MPARGPVITGVVEGRVDEAVFRRLVRMVGAQPGPVLGKLGKGAILKRLKGYNEAARHSPWLVLVDLDHDAPCAPPFCSTVLPDPAPLMRLRVAVREVETWLMGDAVRIAHFLGVSASRIPREPESLPDPKRQMVEIASKSRLSKIRLDLVPRPESGREVGPAYSSRLIEFITRDDGGWRPKIAARQSESLDRCIHALASLARDARARAR